MAFDVNSTKIVLTAQDNTGAAFKSAESSVERLQKSYTSMIRTLSGGIGAFYAIDMITSAFNALKTSIDALDKLNDLSKSTGIAVERLSGLGLAAKQSGGDLESIAASINKLSVNMGKNSEKFAALGVTAKDPLEAFKQLSDIFVAIEDPQQRAAVAAAALGKSWAGAAPLLAEGGAKIQEMVDKGMRLSGVTKEATDAADKFNDQLAELEASKSKFVIGISAEMLPAFNDIIKAINTAYQESGKLAALWATMGALGAFLYSDEFASTKNKLANLGHELKVLESSLVQIEANGANAGVLGRWLMGDKNKIVDEIETVKAKISALQKSLEVPKPPIKSDDQIFDEMDAAEAIEAKAAAFLKEEKAVADNDSAYRGLLKTLKDKLLLDHEQTEVNKLQIALEALSSDQREKITPAREKELKALAAQVDLKIAHKAALEAYIKVEEESMKDEQEWLDLRKTISDKENEAIQSTQKSIEQIEFETKIIGWSNDARERAIALRTLELSGIDKESQAYAYLVQRMDEALAAKGKRNSAQEAANNAQEAFNRAWGDIERTGKDVFTHIFSDGKTAFEGIGKAIKASIIDLLYQLTVKKWFINVGLGVTGSMASGASSAATSAGGSMLGSLGSSLMGGAMQTGADLGNFFGSIGSVAESGATFGVMDALSGFAMANPWTAAAAAVLAVVGGSSLFGGSEDPNRGKYESSGLSSTDTITRKGGLAGNYYDFYGALGATFNEIPQNQLTGINNAISQVFDQMEKQAKDAGIAVTGLDNLTVRMAVTGQGVQKDLENAILATGEAIAAQLIPNIESLNIKGETLAQTFGRITAAAIAAKAAEQQRLDALATQRRGLEIALMEAQGDAIGALAAKREDELKALDGSLRPLQEQIYAAQNLAKAQAEATQAQVEAAQAQADAAQAAADATATFKDSLTVLISQGRSVRDFLNTLGATGVSMSLATSRNAYIADLLAARAGDADAYGRITKSAGDYIKAGESYSASGNAQRALVGQIKAELSALTPVAALDANTELLKLIKAATESTALSTGNLDVLGIKALFDLSAVLTVIENSEGLSSELKLLMKENTKTYSMILSAALAGGDSDPLKKVLIDGEGIYSASVKALLDDTGIDAASRKLALTAQGDFVAYVDAVMKSDAPSDSKKLALGTNNDILALVNASLNPAFDPEAKKLGLALGSDLERTVNAVWKSGYDQTAIDYANLAVTDIARSVNASFASRYSKESVAFAGLQATDLARIVDASFKGSYSENAVIFASLQATDISRLVDAAFTQEHSQTAVDFALAKAADMTALTRSVMGSLTGDETADALLLSKAQATANLFKTEVSAYLAEDAETVKMAAIINGTSDGKVSVSGAVTFDPSNAMQSVFQAIKEQTFNTALYLKAIAQNQSVQTSAFVSAIGGLGGASATGIATMQSWWAAMMDVNLAPALVGAIPSHATGLANVPYDGYLMTAHAGEAVIDAGTISSLRRYGIPVNGGAANDDLLAEIKALRAEVAGLRGEAVKTSANTRKTADTIVRVTRDGDAMLTATV